MASENTGRFVWYEHLTRDVPAAITFYSDVVGWRTTPFGDGHGDYVMWVGSQGPLGVVMKLPDELEKMGIPPHWTAHVQVDEVDATLARTRTLGGKVWKEATEIPTVGRFAVIADPQGASVSIFSRRATTGRRTTSRRRGSSAGTSSSPATPPRRSGSTRRSSGGRPWRRWTWGRQGSTGSSASATSASAG